ncbi:MAG: hypothetical protein NWQ13_08280 [Glaciimonas sp.]|nr:hypothetical protein [Glaciimonas sp.]
MKRSSFLLSTALSTFIPATTVLFVLGMQASTSYAKEAQAVQRPLIPLLKAAEVKPFCDKGLSDVRSRVSIMEALPVAQAGDTERVLADWNKLQIAFEDLQGPVDILNNVSPDPKVRSATEACLIEVNKFATNLLQNEKLYARIKAIAPTYPISQN